MYFMLSFLHLFLSLAVFILDYCQIEVVQLDIFEIGKRWLLLHEIRVMAAVDLHLNATFYAQYTTLKSVFENS